MTPWTLVVVFAAYVTILLLVGVGCVGRPQHDEFTAALDRLTERTREIAGRSAGFDHDQTLREITRDSDSGVLLRLDECLDRVVYHSDLSDPVDLPPVVAMVDLVGGRVIAGVSGHGGDGNLELRPGEIATFTADLKLPEIGVLELEMASGLGGVLQVELAGPGTGEAVTVDLHAIGDGHFHSYRVELVDSLVGWTGGRLGRLRFRSLSGKLQVRRAVVLSPMEPFQAAPFGVTHFQRGGETRRAVFQWATSALRFSIAVAKPAEAELAVGVSALLPGRPVQVAVVRTVGGFRRVLHAARIDGSDPWVEWRLPLGTLEAEDDEIELEVVADQPNLVFWSNPTVVTRRRRPLNVIMVLEDSLRADRLSCAGYARPTTPVKDAFARRGVRFANCYAQATKTRFSCPSFMTSLYPTASGVEGIWNLHPRLHENHITLAEVLRRRGFATASFIQNSNAGSPAGLDQGFSYLFENVGNRPDDLYAGAPVRWIEGHRDENFFLYLHVADPHEPYDPPEGFKTFFAEFETTTRGSSGAPLDRRDPLWLLGARRALYDCEVRHNDHWFAAFLSRLEELGLADDTLIVFMADHGEHLGEHGRWSHCPPGYVQVLHTPLIMVYPRRIPARTVIEEPVQNLDIMPTILDLAGVDGEGLLLQGDSLMPLIEGRDSGFFAGRAVYSEEALLKKSRYDSRTFGSVFVGRWHLIDSPFAPMRLYDLDRDPVEEHPKLASRRLGRRYRLYLDEMQRAELEIWLGVTRGEESPVSLDPETVRHLRALGYLE